MKRKIICTVMLLICVASSLFTANAVTEPLKVFVNNEEIFTDVAPFIQNGRTFLPVRAVSEALGAEVFWDEGNKAVYIDDYRIYELKDLAYGIFMIQNARYLSIDVCCNNLIDYRNALVQRASNADEILSNCILSLDSTNEHMEWQIENYIPKLCEYPYTKAVNTDDVKNAFYYYQMAIHNVKLGYDVLKKYNPTKDNSLVLQEYAVYVNKAWTYYTDATDLFTKCCDGLFDVIYSY